MGLEDFEKTLNSFSGGTGQEGAVLNLNSAHTLNPDEEADKIRLQRATGIPANLMSDKKVKDDAKRQAFNQSFDLSNSPATVNFLRDPSMANVAKDDLTFMQKFEDKTRQLRRLWEDAIAPTPARAYATAKQGMGGAYQFVGENVLQPFINVFTPESWKERYGRSNIVTIFGQNMYNDAKFVEQQIQREHPLEPGSFPGMLSSALQSMYLQAPMLGAGLIAPTVKAGTAATLAGMGAVTGGQTYSARREKGFSPNAATASAAWDATVEVGTELLPTKTLFDLLKPSAKQTFARAALKVGELYGEEMVGESLATFLQDANDKFTDSPTDTLSQRIGKISDYITSGEALQNWISTIGSTAIQTTLMGGAGIGVNRFAQGRLPKVQQENKELIDTLTATEESRLKQRLPEGFADFAQKVGDQHNISQVYFQADKVVDEAIKSGMNENQVVEWLNQYGVSPQELDTAIRTDGKIAFDYGKVAQNFNSDPVLTGLQKDMLISPFSISEDQVDSTVNAEVENLIHISELYNKEQESKIGQDDIALWEKAILETPGLRGRVTKESLLPLIARANVLSSLTNTPAIEHLNRMLQPTGLRAEKYKDFKARQEEKISQEVNANGQMQTETEIAKEGAIENKNPLPPNNSIVLNQSGEKGKGLVVIDKKGTANIPAKDNPKAEAAELTNKAKQYDNPYDFVNDTLYEAAWHDTQYFNGKIYNYKGISSISDLKILEYSFQHRKQKIFYRATDTQNEHLIDVKSKNHLTNETYGGMSVDYTPLYKEEWKGAQPKPAKKYIGVVTGDVIGYGHDGEPIITNVKWIQKPVEKLPQKYSREKIEVIDRDTPFPWTKLDYGIMGGEDTVDEKAPITKQELFSIWNKAHELSNPSGTPEEGVQTDLYQSDTNNPLGSLSITHDGQNIISLFEKANRSTFLHETAHIFLNDLKYVAETQNVQTEEWNKVKEWLGIGEDGNITVEQHEKFADHFEAYLKEGRAPTTELRNAFRKFKRWLVRIYDLVTSSRDLNVTVSPEISDLFDHLLATEEEIKATREQAALIAMLDDKLLNETGLTQEQLKEYRNIVAQAEESGFERRDKYKLKGREERLKGWRRQANAEATNVPLFGLLNRLKESGGVSRKSIIKKYGDDNVPASHPIFKKDGLDIDMAIAEHGFDYGYESAGSFIGDFKTSPNESLWVKKRIAQLEMEHDYQQDTKEAIRTASLRRQLEIESEVLANRIAKEEQAHEKQQQEIEQRWKDADRKLKEAIKLDKKNDEIHRLREKLALAKQRAKKPEATSRAALREWAKRVVSLKTIRQINNINSLIFESYRHRQEAISCARQGKWADAFNANEQARMTEALITESYKVIKTWNKMEARWKNVAKWTNENKDVKIGTRFRDQINRILNLYGLSERTFDASIPDLQSFVASLGAGDELSSAGASLSPWINVETGNYTTLNWQQLQELHEAINYLYGHGRDEIEGAKLSNGQRVKDYAEEILKAQEGIKNIKYLMTDATKIGRIVQGVQNNYRKFFAHTAILRFIAQRLDGYQNVGSKHKIGLSEQLVQDIDSAMAKSNDMWIDIQSKTDPLFMLLMKNSRKVFGNLRLPDKFNQYGMTWTKERVVAACLNMGNDSNMQRLRDGFGLVDEDIHAIASKLTVEEWQTIQKIWDTVNSLWPQIADVHERLNYFRPKKQEARALKVLAADGEVELAGGYYPVMYDRSMDRDAARWSEQDDILASNEAILQVPIAKSGFTKGRAGKVERPLHLSLSVLGRHLNDTIRYITLSEVIRDADRVFRDRKLEARNLETIGREMQDMIRPALKQTLRPDPKNIGWFEFGRTRMSLYYMGYNMWTALQNITGVFPAIRQAGAKNYLDGIYHVLSMGNPYKAHKAMLEMSGYMRLRESNIERDMKRQLRNFEMGGIEIKGRRYHFDDVRGLGFAAMRFIDATVALPAWWGVYKEQMQVNGGNIQKAVESADATVNKAIGSGLDIDTTAFQRHGFFSLLAPFMSFAAAQQEILSTERKAWKEGKISNADFIYGQMMTWVMPAVMSTFLQGVLMYGIVGALGGGDDDRKKKDMSDYITDLIAYRLMGIPFVRDIYNSALQGFEKKAPITSARMPTTEAWKMIQDLSYRVGNYDGSEKSVKALGWSSAETISLTSGIPTSRIYQRWIKGTDDIESGSGWWGNHFIPQERKK